MTERMFVDPVYRGDEPVAALGQRLNKPGIVGRVAQRFAELVYCNAQAVIEIDGGVGAPQLVLQGLARNHFAVMLD